MKLSSLLDSVETNRPSRLPSLERLLSACDRINKRWPDEIQAPLRQREHVVAEMLDRVKSDRWEKATVASVIRAGRVVFDPDFRERPDQKELRNFYINEIKSSSRPVFLSGAMSIYLNTFEPYKKHTVVLAAALFISRHRFNRRWQRLLQNVPYLLIPATAPQNLGRAMTKMEDPWRNLVAMGFQDPHALGFLQYAHLSYVSQMKPKLTLISGIDLMLGWLEPRASKPRIEGAKEAIEALLDPWLKIDPSEQVKDRLLNGLVAIYGDPRVGTGQQWQKVSTSHKNVLLRWLTGANIKFFLDVVTEVETSHMWVPRREYWWGLYQQGRIDAAWVAFSQAAAEKAKLLLATDKQFDKISYGKQVAGGSRIDTSLLILKIGRCIVVEGSHSYKVQVFKPTDSWIPRLFEEKYDCERIREEPVHFQQIHHVKWQDRISEKLALWA